MKNMFKRIATSMLALTLLLSAIPANAQTTSFAERCQTYGFYGLDDWFHVQLQDMTGNVSDSCKADDWSVTMSSGSTNVFGEIVKNTQEVKIKRQDGGSINVRAKSGSEMTDDNYIMLVKANSDLPTTSFAERCQTYGFYGLDDWFHVQLQDMTGNVSDSCVADDWSVTMNSGETNVFGEIVKSTQEVKIKRQDGGGMNVRAENGSEMTDDNYIMLVKANSSIGTLPPPAGYEDEVIINMSSFENPFPDTDINTLEGLSASELYRRAVIGGYPDGEFKGSREVNRAEAAKFLLLARFGTVADISNNGKFPDVKDGEWYVPFVVTAANKGIINGYPDGFFRPANTVNTAEFLKMLTLTFSLSENLDYSYSDVKSTDWFAKYAGIAEKYNLFPDRSTYLNPGDNLTRKEVAIAIYQYLLNR